MAKETVSRFGLVIGAVVLLLFFYVYQRIQILRLGYKVRDVEKKITEKEKENASLKLEIVKLTSPEHIAAEVKRLNLGLEPPKEKQIIRAK
jgi:cell division protein FtsL